MKFPLSLLLLLLIGCTKDGNVYDVIDPDDQHSTDPLIIAIYDPNALGDRTYNDLIFQGVEVGAKKNGMRTMQLSPQSEQEGMSYIETIFRELEVPQDTIKRLIVVAGAIYDDYVRQNSHRFANNPYVDVLFLETRTPLKDKGSTLYLHYYGAMYEAGAVAPHYSTDVLLIAANPTNTGVGEAVNGFVDGFNTNFIHTYPQKTLVKEYLGSKPNEGFLAADSTALKILFDKKWTIRYPMFVPICGGAANTFIRLAESVGNYWYMGVDCQQTSVICHFSAVKHIDRAVALCIDQWTSGEGIPKHQTFGLAEGYTEVIEHPMGDYFEPYFSGTVDKETRAAIHEEALRKEAEYEK